MVYLILAKSVLLSGFHSHFFNYEGKIVGWEVIVLDEERIYAGSNSASGGEEPA